MSTIASLLALASDPGIKPWDEIVKSSTQAQTGLRELADLKRKQASEALLMERIQNDPDLRQRLFGDGSILGSLQTAPVPQGGQPAPGALTQSPLGPGGGPAQQIPAAPDLSRFANVPPQGGGPIPPDVMAQTMPTMTPPQGGSVLGSLGPQGGMPGPMQQSRNPLLEMAARDPRAALMLQQQMQTQQDRQMKMQEQGIQNRIKIVDYLARMAQGTSDQDSWKQFIEEADRVQPGAGGRLPQMYSKDARDRIVAQGLDAKEALTLQVQDLTAQAALIRARKEGRSVDVDNQLRAMGVQPGQETPAQIKEALQAVQQGKVDVSAAQGVGQAQQRSLGETAQKRLESYDKTGMAGHDMHTVLDEAERLMGEGVYGNSLTDQATMAAYKRGLFQDDKKAQRTARLQELGSQLVLAHGSLGSGVSAKDAEIYAKAAGNFQQAKNLEEMKQSISSMRTIGNAAISNANAARESYEKTGKLPAFQERGNQGQGQPTRQAPAASAGTPVGQMSKEDLLAEKAAILARGGR